MTAPLTILVAGSRNLPDPGVVGSRLGAIALTLGSRRLLVRHGACPGPTSADQAAADWIAACGDWLGVTEDPMAADWDHCGPTCPRGTVHRRTKKPGDIWHPGSLATYCPGAGPRRNAAMVAKLPVADRMLAFPLDASWSGTRGCMTLAARAGIPIAEVRP